MNFGYEYFCGANVVVELEGTPAFEAVGISYQIQETKRPIYGYSSRFFDAVARGQVLVQGTFIVNYVSQDYVFAVLTANDTTTSTYTPTNDFGQQLKNIDARKDYAEAPIKTQLGISQSLRAQYWKKPPAGKRTNPHDVFGGLTIKVTMGDRNRDNNYDGQTGFILTDVYIIGRGTRIQISEDVIVEEYSFFARDVMTITQQIITQVVSTPVNAPIVAASNSPAEPDLSTSMTEALMNSLDEPDLPTSSTIEISSPVQEFLDGGFLKRPPEPEMIPIGEVSKMFGPRWYDVGP